MARARRSLTRAEQMVVGAQGPLENPETIARIPPQYRPIFRSGDTVQLNLDAEV